MQNFRFVSLLLWCCAVLSACANMQFSNPFTSDPLTGGQDATTSILLEVPLPTGMQKYSTHGFISSDENGMRNGLETFRGNIESNEAAITMFNGLKNNGWDLRMQNRKGERAIFVYQKNREIAVISFHPQGIMTIMEIWRGRELEKGAILANPKPYNTLPSIAPEEYEPLNGSLAPLNPEKAENPAQRPVQEKEL